MPRGQNPSSLENLKKSPRTGRSKRYGDRKTHEVLVSEEGWQGALAVAQQAECSGISEFLEKLGRGDILLLAPSDSSRPILPPSPPPPPPVDDFPSRLEALIETTLLQLRPGDRAAANKLFKRLRSGIPD